MDSDPNKKESKGKRILKKALRRNSKTSNNSETQQIGATRSKSFGKKRVSIEIKEDLPLPKPDGIKIKDKNGPGTVPIALNIINENDDQENTKKRVEIQDAKNDSKDVNSSNTKQKFEHNELREGTDVPGSSKKILKRKLEEESGAGTSGASTGASDTDADDKDPSKDKKKKNRCAVCRKKVGLTGFECRCGGLFCAVHRYSDKHDCSFDYRELGAQEIRRNNPVVVSQKIHKI